MNPLDQAEQIINCASCGWDKFCIKPPQITREEINSIMKNHEKKLKESKGELNAMLKFAMDGMQYAGKDKESVVCPQFAKKLKNDKTVIEKIKKIMQEGE